MISFVKPFIIFVQTGCCELDYPVNRKTFRQCLPNYINCLNGIRSKLNGVNKYSGIRYHQGLFKGLYNIIKVC